MWEIPVAEIMEGFEGQPPAPQVNVTWKFYLKFYSEILILLGNFNFTQKFYNQFGKFTALAPPIKKLNFRPWEIQGHKVAQSWRGAA